MDPFGLNMYSISLIKTNGPLYIML